MRYRLNARRGRICLDLGRDRVLEGWGCFVAVVVVVVVPVERVESSLSDKADSLSFSFSLSRSLSLSDNDNIDFCPGSFKCNAFLGGEVNDTGVPVLIGVDIGSCCEGEVGEVGNTAIEGTVAGAGAGKSVNPSPNPPPIRFILGLGLTAIP